MNCLNRHLRIPVLLSCFFIAPFAVKAQADSMKVAANAAFKNNGSKRFWMGFNMRFHSTLNVLDS